MKLHSMLIAASVLVMAGGAQAQSLSADFDDFTNGGGQATQADTGLPVLAYGDLPGWTKSGFHSVHVVEREPGNFAPMFYNGNGGAGEANAIQLTDPIAANALGTVYNVSFLGAFGNYSDPRQVTQAGDSLLFSILGSAGTIAAFNYTPTSFTFSAGNFSYTGTGTGPVTLRIASLGNAGQFGGAVDNIRIAAVPEPAVWTMLILGFGMAGMGLRRRKPSVRVTYA